MYCSVGAHTRLKYVSVEIQFCETTKLHVAYICGTKDVPVTAAPIPTKYPPKTNTSWQFCHVSEPGRFVQTEQCDTSDKLFAKSLYGSTIAKKKVYIQNVSRSMNLLSPLSIILDKQCSVSYEEVYCVI